MCRFVKRSMSPKLPLNPKKILRVLQSVGFVTKRTTGSHVVLYREADRRIVVVPFHTRDLPKGTAKSILNSAGLSLDDYYAI